MMNVKQLESFVTIVQLGSFIGAAARLNTSQSTISARIQELERVVGAVLFDRTQRIARLTTKGRELVPYAHRVVSAVAEMQGRVAAHDTMSGVIRMGIAEMVAISWLPDLVALIRERYPRLTLEFNILLTSEILARMHDGDLDMAIVPGSRFEGSLKNVSVGTVRFAWLAGKTHKAVKRVLTPSDLRKLRILSLGENSYHSHTMHEWLDVDTHEMPRVDLCNSMSVIASLTAAGLGVSLLPKDFYAREIRAGKLQVLPARPDVPPVEFSAVYPRSLPNLSQKLIADLAMQVSTFQKSVRRKSRA